MGSIVDFIDARLREDERAARAVSEQWRDWRFERGDRTVRTGRRTVVASGDGSAGLHIARHDPGQVLREVLAKRLIVTSARLPERDKRDHLLRCIALCWADHADYRHEWIL
ncbi:MAG: hypothetical protein J2P18_08280 [Nocardia sp.]|nr:hypothetical protein [Nocardia sp.]